MREYLLSPGAEGSASGNLAMKITSLTLPTLCDTASDVVLIKYPELELDLGSDQKIDLGDKVTIDPEVRATGNLLSY